MVIVEGGLTTYGNIMQMIGLLFLFVLIIIACYFTTRFVAGRQLGQRAKISNFKPLDVYRISQNKYLQIVKIGSKYIVLAVCKDTVTVITELNEDEVILPSGSPAGSSFKDIFSKISKNKDVNLSGKFPEFTHSNDNEDN